MGFVIGDRVVKNRDRWQPSEFDRWGAGVGVGEVVGVLGGLPTVIDVRWPAGRCYQRADEVLLVTSSGWAEVGR
jgi:hypothetical protein